MRRLRKDQDFKMGDGYKVNVEKLSLRALAIWSAIQSSGPVFVDFWSV